VATPDGAFIVAKPAGPPRFARLPLALACPKTSVAACAFAVGKVPHTRTRWLPVSGTYSMVPSTAGVPSGRFRELAIMPPALGREDVKFACPRTSEASVVLLVGTLFQMRTR